MLSPLRLLCLLRLLCSDRSDLLPFMVHGSAAWNSGDGWLLLFDETRKLQQFEGEWASPLCMLRMLCLLRGLDLVP